MKNLKKPACLPRKAAEFSRMMQSADMKKLILLNFPYIIAFYMVEKAAWLYRHCNGDSVVDRLMVLFMNFGLAYKSVLPSFHPFDLMVGLVGAAALKAVIYFKGKNAKKYRQGEEYGSARWGNQKDIEPFIDPVFENNVILTQTERLMMSGRPKHPKYGGFVGMYELVVNDKVQRENINSINYFRDDKLVQQAISDMEKLMAARQQSKEQERGSTKKSVLDALRSLKAKKQEQPAQEQDKPKKAKKKGMEL